MAKKKTHETDMDDTLPVDTPAELPAPEPDADPEPLVESGDTNAPDPPAPTEADLDAEIAALQAKKAALAPPPDHTTHHGTDSIVDPTGDKSYHIWVSGQRYVHVGEHNGEWVYRPD